MNNNYNYGNRCCYKIFYHIILVCKYRRKILSNPSIENKIIELSKEILERYNIKICITKSDNDHIHYLIESLPTYSISFIIGILKSYTTFHIWKEYDYVLKNFYWKKRILWTDGYFLSTVGNICKDKVYKYIENQ